MPEPITTCPDCGIQATDPEPIKHRAGCRQRLKTLTPRQLRNLEIQHRARAGGGPKG